jgi:hypothetical protein
VEAEIIRAEVRGADLILLLDDVTLHLVA